MCEGGFWQVAVLITRADEFLVVVDVDEEVRVGSPELTVGDGHARKCLVNSRATCFSALGIKPGDELLFVPTGLKVSVVDDKTIDYRGERFSLSGFTKKHIPKPNASGAYQGPKYFSFKGRMLLDIRGAGKAKSSASVEHWDGKTQLAKLIARRGGNEGAFGGILHFFSRKRPCVKQSKWRNLLESVGLKFDERNFVVDWSAAKNPL